MGYSLKILNLGWGVQSWTMAAMVALGEMEPVNFAIHSDTSWESSETYQFSKKWTPWLENHGLKVITVNDKEQAAKALTPKTDIPAFSLHVETHKKGMLRRQCTGRWKIDPIRRYISKVLSERKILKSPKTVEQWLGITRDESQRAKASDVKFISHRFPLLELNMSRTDCYLWLRTKNLPNPGKSSCVICPYHSRSQWEKMKRKRPSDWKKAVEVDNALREVALPYLLFIHRQRIPLSEAIVIPEDFGATQLSLFEGDDFTANCDSG